MDWAKAKSIILLLLLAFNLFLGWMLVSNILERNIPVETIKNTEIILKSRKIGLKCEIPRYNKSIAKLEYGSYMYEKERIAKMLLGDGYAIVPAHLRDEGDISGGTENITYTNGDMKLSFDSNSSFIMTDGNPHNTIKNFNAKNAESWLRSNYSDKGLIGADYVLDDQKANSDGSIRFVFIEKYKGILIFGNYFKAVVSQNGIMKIEAGYREIRGFTPKKVNNMIAAYQILLKNFDGSGNPVITSIDLGFKDTVDKESTDQQSSEQPPVWRVKLEGEESPRYFDTTEGMQIPE